MSELPETAEVPETESAESAATDNDLPKAETAFIIMKRHDGSWFVTSDVTQPFAVDRVATRADVRIGTTEITHLLSHQDLAALVAATLKASQENN